MPIPAVPDPKPQPQAPPEVARAPPPPPTAPRPSVVTNPDWIRRPSADQFAQYYPERAQRLEMAGRATIVCTVTAAGTLQGCSVTSEDPADYGFGDAAIKMSRFFKMKPATRDGVPVEGLKVTIPLRFNLGG